MIRAYLDNNATTRLAPEALAAMKPYLTELYLNPSSTAGDLLGAGLPFADAARALVRLFDVVDEQDEIVLTSGASEANSWAVHAAVARREPGHIVSTAIEHPSLLAALEALREVGWSVDLAAPDPTGRVDPDALLSLLKSDTRLVSIMLANNETGVIQPVGEIGRRLRAVCPEALFHVDATQAVGRIPISLDGELGGADLVSFSSHKFHGPKSIGGLLVAAGLEMPPLIHGSQARGRRGGTPDPATAAGLAAAAELAAKRLPEMARVAMLRDAFEATILQCSPRARVLGREVARLPNTSCILFPDLDAEALVEQLAQEGVVVATGSACQSGSTAPSHVLLAMGVTYDEARSVLRFSLSHNTTSAETEIALDTLRTLVRKAA